jgi:hypothetical protein
MASILLLVGLVMASDSSTDQGAGKRRAGNCLLVFLFGEFSIELL